MSKLQFIYLLFALNVMQAQAQSTNITGPVGSGNFGKTITVLTNGNYVVTDPLYDDGAVTDVGAVYLYNGTTHALISMIKGSTINDQVGSSAIIALSNGNYVVSSMNWDNGVATNTGAITWGNGGTGVSGIVSSSNSLVGSTANDNIGNNGVSALSNGNYVVKSSNWDNGAAANAGAVTWGNGANGITGVVSGSNSLVGSTSTDGVGSSGITILTNGNYIVPHPSWDNGVVVDAGAATWVDGSSGITGIISSSNSLVGSTNSDFVGNNGVTSLTNGNYVVNSQNWDNGAATNAGAVTWGNGTTGITGIVSSGNSLVGSMASDNIGSPGVTALTNGNYVVASQSWDNGAVANIGAATWGNGTTGITGVINSSNSLLGGIANDNVGSSGVSALNNGNYVVRSQSWDNGAAVNAGAITWGNGVTGTTGVVSSSNSLVGSVASDNIGSTGLFTLSNGNYVVGSSAWDNGVIGNAGAATWGNGTTGVSGIITSSNSLVGAATNDNVGTSGIALSNGNYVVYSTNWDNGAATNAGAVTWGNGTTGTTGVVSSSNSLVGSTTNDNIGINGIAVLTNGNYVVRSQSWRNGAMANAGAVTWGNGATGTTGVVSSSNSLVGSTASDFVGNTGVTVLTNGNYVVRNQIWDNGVIVDAGAITWGNGSIGITGIISSANSLVGSTNSDLVGGGTGVTALSNGNYVVVSTIWDNGGTADVGAVTWGNGTAGVSGVISSSNSLVGSVFGDNTGIGGITALANGNYIVRSQNWDNGATANSGAMTPANGSIGALGLVTSCNSVMGTIVGGGSVMVSAYNSTYDYVIVGRPNDNIISIYVSSSMALSVTLDANTINISGTTAIPLIATAGCRIIATLTPNGASPVSGATTAKVWVEAGVPTEAGHPFVARHYEITPASNASTATGRVTLYFTQTEFDDFNAHAGSTLDLPTAAADVTGIANLRIGKYPGTSSDGTGLPGTYSSAAEVIDPSDAAIVWNSTLSRWELSFDVTGFSGFIVQTNTLVLPLQLLNFSAALNNNDVLVSWKTTNETGTRSFDVERSLDGRNFTKAGTVAAANRPAEHDYSYTDAGAAINATKLYYRLKQTDIDDKYTYSQIVLLLLNKNNSITIYPNPASDVVIVSFSNRRLLHTVAIITDMQGKQLKQFSISSYQGQADISNLPQGMYVIKLEDGTAVKFNKN